MKKLILGALILGASAMTMAQVSDQQKFPPKQITLVVPFPPGGPTDALGRLVAQELHLKLNVPVVVENKGGASATIGSGFVARAAPDGSVLLFNATHHVTNPAFFKKLPYDTKKDFTPIALVASIPSVLVVNPSVSATTVQGLIAQAKSKPDALSMATFGGANQLAGELFKSMAGVTMENIGFPGEAPAVTAVLGGHVPLMFDTLSTVLPHVKAGKVRALGVTGAQRNFLLPDIPTISEAGLNGYEAVAWFGLFMPGQNADIAMKLSNTMADILKSSETQKRLKDLGAEPGTLTGQPFVSFVNSELKKWAEVGEKSGIEKQ